MVKKQHYVPQFYLKNFGDKNHTLFVFDKVRKISFGSKIKDIAQERYFYEVPISNEAKAQIESLGLDGKTIVEHALQFYDDKFAANLLEVIQNIRASATVSRTGKYLFSLSDEQRWKLSYFAIFQEFRTRENREAVAQFNQVMTDAFVRCIAERKFPEVDMSKLEVIANEEMQSILQTKILLNDERISKLAEFQTYERIWLLGVNRTNKPLIISDHPIVKQSHHKGHFFMGTGWMTPFLEVAIPLTPEFILIQVCPMVYRGTYKHGLEWVLNNSVFDLNEENVSYYNSLQCRESHTYLFSNVDEWSLAERYLKDFPQYGNPFRQRVSLMGFGNEIKLPKGWGMKPSLKGN